MNTLLPFIYFIIKLFFCLFLIVLPFGLISAIRQSRESAIKLIKIPAQTVRTEQEYKVHIMRCRAYLKSKGKNTIY